MLLGSSEREEGIWRQRQISQVRQTQHSLLQEQEVKTRGVLVAGDDDELLKMCENTFRGDCDAEPGV